MVKIGATALFTTYRIAVVSPLVVAVSTSETSTICAPGAVADTISTSSVFSPWLTVRPGSAPLCTVVRVVAGSPKELR
jgi:hypothetical protein